MAGGLAMLGFFTGLAQVIGFAAVVVLFSFIVLLLNGALAAAQTPFRQSALVWALSVASILFFVFQYYALTGVFLASFIVFQFGVFLVARLLQFAYDIFAGIGSEERGLKMFVITNISVSRETQALVLIMFRVLTAVCALGWLFALGSFFFVRDAETRHYWIFLGLILTPMAGALILNTAPIIAMMLNPDVDNDVRNKIVGSIVSTAFYASAMIVWPAILFPAYRGVVLGGSHIAAWIMIVLAIATAILFLLGASRFYSQKNALKRTRREIVASARKVLAIPQGTFRQIKVGEVVVEIRKELQRAYDSHRFYGFYVAYLVHMRFGTGEEVTDALLSLLVDDYVLEYNGTVTDPDSMFYPRYFSDLRNFGDKIPRWNVKAAHLQNLFDIYCSLTIPDHIRDEHVFQAIEAADKSQTSFVARTTEAARSFGVGLAPTFFSSLFSFVFGKLFEAAAIAIHLG